MRIESGFTFALICEITTKVNEMVFFIKYM